MIAHSPAYQLFWSCDHDFQIQGEAVVIDASGTLRPDLLVLGEDWLKSGVSFVLFKMVKLNPIDYRIALFAVLEIEAKAVLQMLDHRHDGEFSLERGDDYAFFAGDINGHNVIIATLPAGHKYGPESAASLSSQTKKTFRNLWFSLLVGVAAGLPDHSKDPPIDIRLGDILVAQPISDSAGLISYDLGKVTHDGFKLLQGGHVLEKTDKMIMSVIGGIKIDEPDNNSLFLDFYEAIKDKKRGIFQDPGQDEDKLYGIDPNGIDYEVHRERRPDNERTRVWYGPIGTGGKLMKNAQERDRLRDEYGIIGLEMEAAGVLDNLPAGVIRGVCDYGDNRKNKQWQPYAAAMAASYAKAILMKIGQGENALLAVATSEANIGCEILCDLPSQTDRFFGREAELRSMTQSLQRTDGRRGAVLCGISGSGKTQLAREYVSREKDKLSAIIWINAASHQTVDQSLSQCAERILLRPHSLPQNTSRISNQTIVMEWLKNLRSQKWLIVIDGMDNLMIAKNLFDSFNNLLSGHGAICITSTSPNTARACKLAQISVEHLDIGSASSLILWRALENTTHDENIKQWARDAAKILNRYALGLELAGILIHEGIVRPDTMLPTIFETKYNQLTTIDPVIWNWGKSHTLFDIFNALYADLKAKSSVAGDLLTFCSIYGPQEISIAFLQKLVFGKTEQAATNQEPWARLQELFKNDINLSVAVGKLHDVFLAYRNFRFDRSLLSFSVHGTVCQWRFATIGDQRSQWIVEVLQALAFYLQSETKSQKKGKSRQTEIMDTFRKFYPVSLRCLGMLQEYVPPRQLEAPDGLYAKQYYNICLLLAPLISNIGNYNLAKTLFSDAIKFAQVMCADNFDELVFPLLRGLARCFRKVGDMTKSGECLQSAGKLAVKLYGDSSIEAADIYAELRNVRDHIDVETDQRKRALIASTGSKMARQRHDPANVTRTDGREFAVTRTNRKDVSTSLETNYPMERWYPSKDDLDCKGRFIKLLDAGLDPNAKINGSTALHAAAEKGYIYTVEMLLERGAITDSCDSTKETPLHGASRFGWYDTVELLVQSGADVNHVDSHGVTPLHLASWHGRPRIVEFLLQKMANPNAKADDGNSPLLLAILHDDIRIFMILHKHGVDADATTSETYSQLKEALDRGFTEIARFLLGQCVDVTEKYWDKKPRLHNAVIDNNLDRVELLLGLGIEMDATDHEGRTALNWAAMIGNADMIRLLCSAEAGPITEMDERPTESSVAENKSPNHEPHSQIVVGAPLVTERSLINAVDDAGRTPLMVAAIMGNSVAAEALLSCHANLTVQDLHGNTCIHLACHRGDVATVETLLDHGADWKTLNKYGFDALDVARINAHYSVVDLLRSKMDRPTDSSNQPQIAPTGWMAWLQCRLIGNTDV